MKRLATLLAFPCLAAALFVGCGTSPVDQSNYPVLDASGQTVYDAAIPLVDAACSGEINAIATQPGIHVPVGTEVTYSTNPPVAGPHYSIWAGYTEFTTPVDRRYYVHSMEHGAVVFAYNCPAGCPEVLEGFRQIVAALPPDPVCNIDIDKTTHHYLITPDPALDAKVAVMAWGKYIKMQCFDRAPLEQFARDNYGKGPEIFCGNGQMQF